MPLPDPVIPFDPTESADVIDFDARTKFWESCRPWLAEKGYTLYKNVLLPSGMTPVPSLPTIHNGHIYGSTSPSPYAYHDYQAPGYSKEDDYWTNDNFLARVIFCQDSENRHVVLKLVGHDTDELRIFRLLLEEQKEREDGTIPGILPTLDVIPFAGHWLAVMPRWGKGITSPWFSTAACVIQFIRNLLQGLVFLHSRRIIHRDVDSRNILVNHIRIDSDNGHRSHAMRFALRKIGHLQYAIYDFNLSILLPMSTRIEDCRMSQKASWFGALDEPPDIYQGEYDYNPFAYDVGILGITFCQKFQYLTQTIPMLAPLLDGMTTRYVNKRFTADQALAFLQDRYAEMSEDERSRETAAFNYDIHRSAPYEKYDRWVGLPADFVQRWAHLKEPKLSLGTRTIRWVCCRPFNHKIVRNVRRLVDGRVKPKALPKNR